MRKGKISKGDRCLIIADVGQAHEGSLGIAHSYIDAAAGTGIDMLKFQTHIAEAESSPHEPFRKPFSYEDPSRYEYWKRMEFTKAHWKDLKKHCDDTGLEFISSPFSCAAVDLLENVGVRRYKIGSGEVNNFLLLEKIARTGKPIILSSGMSSYNELDEAVRFLGPFNIDISILQCTTNYPAAAEEIGLNVIMEIKKRYPECTAGISDHSGTPYTGLAAATLGAKIIEVHIVFDKRMFGPDAHASLTIEELKFLVSGIRFIETSLKHPVDKNDNSRFQELKKIFGKSLCVSRDMKSNDILTFDDLEAKKPEGKGITARSFHKVLGKRLKKDKSKYDFLKKGDFI